MPSKWPDKRKQATRMCQNLNTIKANDAYPPCGASVLPSSEIHWEKCANTKPGLRFSLRWLLPKKKFFFLFGISQIETISKLIVWFVHLLSSSIIQIAKKIFSQLPSSCSLYSLKALFLSSSAPNGNYSPKVFETPFVEGFFWCVFFCRNLGFNFSAFLIFRAQWKISSVLLLKVQAKE